MNIARISAAVAGAALLGMLTIATAQKQPTPAETADAGRKPITPRKPSRTEKRTAAAVAEPKQVEGKVDWTAVNKAVDETADADAAAGRQIRAQELTRAMSADEKAQLRPDGLRAMSPRQWKNVSEAEVKQTRVPVLAPNYGEAAAMRVTATENSYTAFCKLSGGAYVEILGTRMRVIGGAPAAAREKSAARAAEMRTMAALDAPYVISRHEQGVDLSFSRFNVAYQISVYCPNPDADPRCADNAYVTTLAENLVLLNPEEGVGQ